MKSKIIFILLAGSLLINGCSNEKTVTVKGSITAKHADFDMSANMRYKEGNNLVFNVEATNTSKDSHEIDKSNFTAKDKDGNTYQAIAYGNHDHALFGPKIWKVDRVIFEVPGNDAQEYTLIFKNEDGTIIFKPKQ